MSYNAGLLAGAWLYVPPDPWLERADGWASSTVTSPLLLGATVGALGSSTADLVGRKLALLSVAGLSVAGGLITGLAGSPALLLLGRAVAGLGAGMSSVVVNVYIAEIAPADCRGQLGAWAPALGACGVLFSQAASALLRTILPAGSWRLQLGLVALPSLATLLAQGLLVESPRWLLLRGRREQALAAMAALFPRAPPGTLAAEVEAIEACIAAEKDRPTRLAPAELCRRHARPVVLGLCLGVLQQVSGIHAVSRYGPSVLREMGFTDVGALLAAVLVSFVQLSAAVFSSVLLDRIGRRQVAIPGVLAAIGGLALLVVSFAARTAGTDAHWQAAVAAFGIVLFRAAFSFSLGILPYVMIAELFPADARAGGAGVAWAGSWAAGFLVCRSAPALEGHLADLLGLSGGAACSFGICLGMCVAALALFLRALPETSGRQLEHALEAEGPEVAHSST